MSDFDALLAEGLNEVFFKDWGEDVTLGESSLCVIFDTGVEVVDEGGVIDVVSHAVHCKKGDFDYGDTFTRDKDGLSWQVGRLLSRHPDDLMRLYEVTPI